MSAANKIRISYLKARLREIKLDIQQIEYAIECSEKTKHPNISLMRKNKNFLEIVIELKTNIKHILDEVKNGLTREEIVEYEEQLNYL